MQHNSHHHKTLLNHKTKKAFTKAIRGLTGWLQCYDLNVFTTKKKKDFTVVLGV